MNLIKLQTIQNISEFAIDLEIAIAFGLWKKGVRLCLYIKNVSV